MRTIVITGTTSSGKSATLNLLCGDVITPVSVQPSTLSPVEVSYTYQPHQPLPIERSELERGEVIRREVWPLSSSRSWWQLSLALQERRLRALYTPSELISPWMNLSRQEQRLKTPPPSLIELPALERLVDPLSLQNFAAQRRYAQDCLANASCVLCVFNAQETNPQVDEKALQMLKYASGRPTLFTLNRVDLFKHDRDEQASLLRRLNQLKRSWEKVYGAHPMPRLIPISVELPALIYASLNPRATFTEQHLKLLKKLARSEPLLEELSLVPAEWSHQERLEVIPKLLSSTGVKPLMQTLRQVFREV